MESSNSDIVGAAILGLDKGDLVETIEGKQLEEFREIMREDVLERKIKEFAQQDTRIEDKTAEKEKKVAEKLGDLPPSSESPPSIPVEKETPPPVTPASSDTTTTIDTPQSESPQPTPVEKEAPSPAPPSSDTTTIDTPQPESPPPTPVEKRDLETKPSDTPEQKTPQRDADIENLVPGIYQPKTSPFDDILSDVSTLDIPENKVVDSSAIKDIFQETTSGEETPQAEKEKKDSPPPVPPIPSQEGPFTEEKDKLPPVPPPSLDDPFAEEKDSAAGSAIDSGIIEQEGKQAEEPDIEKPPFDEAAGQREIGDPFSKPGEMDDPFRPSAGEIDSGLDGLESALASEAPPTPPTTSEDFEEPPPSRTSEDDIGDDPELSREVEEPSPSSDEGRQEEREALSPQVGKAFEESLKDGKLDFGDDESIFERAFEQLLTFTKQNRRIVYAALVQNKLNEEQSQKVFSDLINQASEEDLVKFIYTSLTQSAEYYKTDDARFLRQKKQRETYFAYLKYSVAAIVMLGLLTGFFLYMRTVLLAYHHYTQGRNDISEWRFQESEEHFQRALELRPDIGEANRYAEAYIKLRRFYDAEKKYTQALEIDPDHFETKFNLGKMFIIKGDHPKAEEILESLLARNEEKIKITESLGQMYLSWADQDPAKIEEAKRIWNALYIKDEDNLSYLAKQIHISSFENDYYATKRKYNQSQKMDADYFEPVAYNRMLSLFIDEYEKNYVKRGERITHARDEQLYLIHEIQKISKKLYQKYKDYLPGYPTITRWHLITDRENEAEKVIKTGIREFQERGTGLFFNPYQLYQLDGIVKYRRNKPIESILSFQSALELNPNSSIDNFYLGKISLENLANNERALEYFNRSKLYWRDTRKSEYLELLNGLAYTYYQSAIDKEADNIIPKNKDLLESMRYWTELNHLWGKEDAVNYAIGNTYLRLGRHRLAIAEYNNMSDKLQPSWRDYQKYSGAVSGDVRKKVEILSDLYHNLSVAQMGLAYQNIRSVKNKTEALNNVIDAIEMKDKIGLLKGASVANYGRINNANIKDLAPYKIADNYLPKTLPNP